MSIIRTVQDWLGRYPGMKLEPLSSVLTDLTKPAPSSYALAPAGNGKTQTDIAGNRYYTNNYVFYATEAIEDEIDRAEMHDFLEDFCGWLEEMAEEDQFPKLSGGYKIEEIEVSNILLYDVTDSGLGTYQVQIQIKLTKWRTE